jgi:hypothetical protein
MKKGKKFKRIHLKYIREMFVRIQGFCKFEVRDNQIQRYAYISTSSLLQFLKNKAGALPPGFGLSRKLPTLQGAPACPYLSLFTFKVCEI